MKEREFFAQPFRNHFGYAVTMALLGAEFKTGERQPLVVANPFSQLLECSRLRRQVFPFVGSEESIVIRLSAEFLALPGSRMDRGGIHTMNFSKQLS